MNSQNQFRTRFAPVMLGLVSVLGLMSLTAVFSGCASDRVKNKAKESAAKFWQDKAYPGKAYDVQVIEAEKTDDGYRVKGIVDGETRVGVFNPDTENFSEGYYSLAHERNKRIAELEEQVKYWKEKSEAQDKEIYKLKVRMKAAKMKPEPAEESSKEAAKSDE